MSEAQLTSAAALRPRPRPAGALRRAAALAAIALLTAPGAYAQEWRTVTSARQLGNEQALRVDVEYAAGELKLAAAPRGTLYQSTLRYDADRFRPKLQFSGSRLKIGITGENVRGRNLKSGLLDLRLSPELPIDLDLQFGAADATLDLGGLRIRTAEISTGASRTVLTVSAPNREQCRQLELQVGAAKFEATRLGDLNIERMKVEGGVGEVLLDFTGTLRSDMRVDIDMGLGSLTLRVPRTVGVYVKKEGFLSSFDSQGLVKRGSGYYSENYDSKDHKIDFRIDAALGTIRVVWVDA